MLGSTVNRLGVVTALAIVTGCGGPSVDPASVEFGSATYTVRRGSNRGVGFTLVSAVEEVALVGRPGDARQLAPCPPPSLIVHDFDHDGRRDLALYSCSFLEIYLQGSSRLGETQAAVAEFKDGGWIRIDASTHPGLTGLTAEFVRRLDPDA